jgi:hypothetical protein
VAHPVAVTARRPSPPAWPTGHIGWSYSGLPEFHGRAASFLSEGAARDERIMFVADDPRPELWPRQLVDEGQLVVLSTAEIYGAERAVAASAQRATFEAALEEALGDGYAGLRVAADNTSLIEGQDRLTAWMGWEEEADSLMQAKPITGLCSFDRTRVDADTLRRVMGIHRRNAAGPDRADATR